MLLLYGAGAPPPAGVQPGYGASPAHSPHQPPQQSYGVHPPPQQGYGVHQPQQQGYGMHQPQQGNGAV